MYSMIKYRLKFKFKKESEAGLNRENNINDILSDVDEIVSDTPIRKPIDNEIILISGEEYKVISVMISFEKENDITYYDFIVLLENKKYEELRKEKEAMLRLQQEMEKRKLEEKYKKYEDYYKKDKDKWDNIKKYKQDYQYKNFFK